MRDTQYFILNKRRDYIRQKGYFTSYVLDSGEKQTKWSRLRIHIKQESSIGIRIFVSERQEQIWNFQCEVQDMKGYPDCLLKKVEGRYLCLMIEDVPEGKNPDDFLEIEIFFQSVSWMSYLPEVYRGRSQEDSFLYRYLSIFQWIYYDMGERIKETPHMLYPAFAGQEYLEWLADWFDLDNKTVWNREQLVYLLENGHWLYGIRGTKRYLEEMIRLFTGHDSYIVEYYQTESYKSDIRKVKRLETLYGENAYVLTVVLPQDAVSGQQEIAILRRIIRSCIPADMECRLVVLEPYIFLDRYTYIGINSSLGIYKEVALDGHSLTPYISVVGHK